MIRADMISTVGRKYLTSNIENDEYSYPKAFSAASLPFVPVRNNNGRAFEKLDIRFVKDNVGRVEQTDSTTGKSKWTEIENQWIELYRNRKPKDGLSATHKVTGDDEWLCEAYMKTDYTKLTERDFQQTINEYLSYLVKEGNVYEA